MCCGVQVSEVTCVGNGQISMWFKYKQAGVNGRLNAGLISFAGDCRDKVRDGIVGVKAGVPQHIPASLLR